MIIPVTKSTKLKVKPDQSLLGFGKYFSDHMFLSTYSKKEGWHDSKIIPYQSLMMDPGASVLHYGQALFEGLKAFRQKTGDKVIFRPEYNWARMCQGAERLCMIPPTKEIFIDGVKKLVEVDQEWIPSEKGSSLYIRPTLIGTEAFLGVRPAEEYLFFIILSPVGSYYSSGFEPLKIWIEKTDVRAAPGGLGATKAAANYANSLKAAYEAKKQGYSQVLWMDVTKEYIEEVGTMNIFFVFKNEIVTPLLDGTILAGGVRDSVIALLKKNGKTVVQRKLKISEVESAAANGSLLEVFGTGTAAVISPVGILASQGQQIVINNNKVGPVSTTMYQEITDIQYGIKPDESQWLMRL